MIVCVSWAECGGAVLDGAYSDLERAPILRFFLTALTGSPGVSERLQRLRRQKTFRKAASCFPPSAKDRAIALGEKSLRRALKPKKKPAKVEKSFDQRVLLVDTKAEASQVVEEKVKPVIQRRKKKPAWIGKCEGCGQKKEIHAWNMCKECLEADMKSAGVLK